MNPKKQIIIFSGIFGIIVLVLFFVLIAPLFKGVRENSFSLVSVKMELAVLQNKAGSIGRLESTYERIRPDLEKIAYLFVDSEVPVDLIEFWENTAKEFNVSIKISPASLKENKADLWDSIGFRLTLTSSFNDFMRFLEKTETSPYLIEIQDLSIKRLAESEIEIGDIRTTLVTKVYVR